jgi:YidC/Oxa1 family membrane protein insertase
MRAKTLLIVFLVGFLGLCAGLVVESGLFSNEHSRGIITLAQEAGVQTKAQDPCVPAAAPTISRLKSLTADNSVEQAFAIGSTDPCSGFKFKLDLINTGAAISKVTLSEFKTRGTKAKEPLVVMQPVTTDTGQIVPMASGNFFFVNEGLQLRLGMLNWKSSDVVKGQDGSQQVSFEAIIKDDNGTPAAKVIKTYKVVPKSYEFECSVRVENLSKEAVTTRFDMFGPAGIGQEDIRGDATVMGAFLSADQLIETAKLDAATIKKSEKPDGDPNLRKLLKKESEKKNNKFIWADVANKYFTAIIRPVPMTQSPTITAPNYVMGIEGKSGVIGESSVPTVALAMQIAPITLAAAGLEASSQTYKFQVFVGPKERSIFEQSPLYQQLGYIHTIQFGACCSMGFIDTMAFAILALMKWAYQYIPNYGVVIIILVLLVRLILHPVTKSSQISMMKMGKLGPQAEEIRKKYADNKQEMNRRIMELYKEQGASPIFGCLPMLLQMPIWIALYSAIYAGIELRGAHFLPFWITDLSGSDAIFSFTPVTIPLIGVIASFNLLPILLGLAMYLQQKLTPSSAQGVASEQMQQQQKMMLIMMPIMMLLFLYNAPSGLNLYIMASTFGGVIEQYFIRKHIREKEAIESETLVDATAKLAKVKKKKPKPFFKS